MARPSSAPYDVVVYARFLAPVLLAALAFSAPAAARPPIVWGPVTALDAEGRTRPAARLRALLVREAGRSRWKTLPGGPATIDVSVLAMNILVDEVDEDGPNALGTGVVRALVRSHGACPRTMKTEVRLHGPIEGPNGSLEEKVLAHLARRIIADLVAGDGARCTP